MLASLSGALLLASAASASKLSLASADCKLIPGSPAWPSPGEWDALNQTISGRLLRPRPPAAACHEAFAEFSDGVCTTVRTRWNSSQWHSEQPASNMWQNFNGYSCLPTEEAPCSDGGYPVYVVSARERAHIVAAVKFAKEKGVRLNIKSTGHDFLGRSVQPKSLSIWTHQLKSTEWHPVGYQPKGCDFMIREPAVTFESGAQMGELYAQAKERKLMIVGGDSKTVSGGGYLTGGGHSPLSPKYGMGADQVLEIEAVLASGEVITANECQNQDLFWAMRGGGGSTFGVVTNFTVRALPEVPITVWFGTLRSNASAEAKWDVVTHIFREWPKLGSEGISGYLIGNPWSTINVPTLQIIMPNTTSRDDLQKLMDPFVAGANNATGGQPILRGGSTFYSGYGNFQVPRTNLTRARDPTSTFPGTGQSKLITSWLWDTEALASPNLKQALMGSTDNETLLFTDFTAGPGTHSPPFMRGGGNAVNPAWRTAWVRPAAEMNWKGRDLDKLRERMATLKTFERALISLAPEGGTYGNEADFSADNWQHKFYGSNYPTLLEIKRRVDPDDVFWCRTCVGSEGWEETEEGQLCRV
ncbi:FAD-binding domain-containing protein [Trichodelitschia bisporula]|uniref:FAD-binding domain-containing protein n=1 Tax=Trichodelitschia bisporula TaxID=703511 RepID=A0A6G1I2I4_9PEZI|nr:FAD-binding domain-containing protein [Trichodelitschia bisporula]